jgi:hypothetical protein
MLFVIPATSGILLLVDSGQAGMTLTIDMILARFSLIQIPVIVEIVNLYIAS